MFNDPELQAAITKSVQKAYIQTTLTYISKKTTKIDSALRHIEQTNNADSIASIKANVEKSLDNPLKKSWQKIEKIVLAKTKPATKPAPPPAKKVIPSLMSLTFNPFVVLRFKTPSEACKFQAKNNRPSTSKASNETLPTTSKASNQNKIASITTGPALLTTIEEEPANEEAAPMEVTPTEPTPTATTSSSSTPAILATTNSQVNQK
jgi:hypothetical protein